MRSTATFVGCALVLSIAILLRTQAVATDVSTWLRPTRPEVLAWSPLAGLLAAALLQRVTRSTWVGILGVLFLVPASVALASTRTGLLPTGTAWYVLGGGWFVLYVSAFVREVPAQVRGWKPLPETIPGLPSIVVTLVLVYLIVSVDFASRLYLGEGYSIQAVIDAIEGSVRAMRWQG